MLKPSDILISSEPGTTRLYLGTEPDFFLRENLDQLRGYSFYINWKIMWSVSPEMKGLINRFFSVIYSNNESMLNATYVMVRPGQSSGPHK